MEHVYLYYINYKILYKKAISQNRTFVFIYILIQDHLNPTIPLIYH